MAHCAENPIDEYLISEELWNEQIKQKRKKKHNNNNELTVLV